ncbi:MAG TPA: hypothetical protein VG722_06705, partial [Tepidisphaeraceae bacterium]|nr:hypothetical protein [Tepidisphaeraceae bacterium]
MTRTLAAGKSKNSSRKSRVVSKTALAPSGSYFDSSWLPWPSLIFLLPMMLIYEIGTRLFAVDPVH